MVLTCDGSKVDAASVDSIFEAHPRIKSEAEALAGKKKRHVKPDGVLYARQKVNWPDIVAHSESGSMGCKWPNLNPQGTENPLSHPYWKLQEFPFSHNWPSGVIRMGSQYESEKV